MGNLVVRLAPEGVALVAQMEGPAGDLVLVWEIWGAVTVEGALISAGVRAGYGGGAGGRLEAGFPELHHYSHSKNRTLENVSSPVGLGASHNPMLLK